MQEIAKGRRWREGSREVRRRHQGSKGRRSGKGYTKEGDGDISNRGNKWGGWDMRWRTCRQGKKTRGQGRSTM